ncbi:DUF4347 domain-containing protein [Leptothoe sp. LEGE 181152]|nr:DUF4347 domain-containing protein [Leptothoe sp. LEGE 181152]
MPLLNVLTHTRIVDVVNPRVSVACRRGKTSITPKTVIFDPHIDNLNLLLDGLQANVQAYVLTKERDGIEQITTFLQQNPTHDLTLIGHGFPGGMGLGSATLELQNLDDYAQQLERWFASTNQAKLTLMACNVAQDNVGQDFIQRLTEITSATIIASAKVLGNGEWLPVANSLFTPETLQGYQGTLAWTQVGSGAISQDIANDFDIELDSQGRPYIIFQDGGNDLKLTVKQFNGVDWVTVGTPGFPGGNASFAGLEFDSNDTPYVVFKDSANRNRASVMKFDGNDWVYVGRPGFSAGGLKDISLTFDGDRAYIAYTDRNQDGRATVQTFNGTTWVNVGQPGFSSGEIEAADLNVDGNGVPYIAYLSASGRTNRVTVQRFINGQWSVVGTEAFSIGAESYAPDIEFDNNNVPYVVYRARGNGEGNKAIVERFNGTDWVQVGNNNASTAGGFHPDIEFDNNNVLHLAIVDQAKKDKVSVRVLENDTWVYLGDSGFSIGPMNFPDLEFDVNNIPYVLYRETFDAEGAIVKGAVVKRLGEPPEVVDEIAPVLESIRRKAPTDEVVSGDTVVFEVTFSEAVTNVGLEDFVINGDPTATIDSVTAIDSTRYEISVTVNASAPPNNIVGIDLAGNPDITDIVGNGLTLREPTIDEVYTITEPELPDPVEEEEEPVVPEPPVPDPEVPVIKPDPEEPSEEPPTAGPDNGNDDSPPLNGLLTVLPSTNGVEVTELGNDNTIRLTFLQGTITEVKDVMVFGVGTSPTDFGEPIGQFSLLNYNELAMNTLPLFTVDSDRIDPGEQLQFAIRDNGQTLFATSSSVSDSEVLLDFSNGVSLSVELATATVNTNLLVNDAQSIDLTAQSSELAMSFSVYREAAMDNTIDFYTTDFANGGIIDTFTGQTLMPGDVGYEEAAIANRLNINLSGTNGQTNTFEASLTGGLHLGIFVIIDGIDPTVDEVVFSHSGANTGNNDHIKHLGDNAFGIEDQAGLGDRDFDDVVVRFSTI